MDGVGMDARTGISDEPCQAVLEGPVRPSWPAGPRGPSKPLWGR